MSLLRPKSTRVIFSDAGTVQLRFCAHTATQTATFFKESFGIAYRLA